MDGSDTSSTLDQLGLSDAGRDGAIWRYRHDMSDMRKRWPRGHRHPEIEANLVVAGRCSYLLGNQRIDLAADTVAWLLPDQDHLLIDVSDDLQMLIAVWTPALVRRAAGEDEDAAALLAANTRRPLLPKRVTQRTTAELARLMLRLRNQHLSRAHAAAGFAWLLRECWSAYSSASGTPAGTRLHPAVEKAARWLSAHAHRPAANDLEALARRCGLSRGRLSRLFASQVGQPIVQYRQQRRLEHAVQLLGEGRPAQRSTPGRHSYLDAALRSGFGSYAQFYRTHVRHFGAPPSERAS